VARLEDLTKGASVRGILPECIVTVVDAHWHGSRCSSLTGLPAYFGPLPVEAAAEAGRYWPPKTNGFGARHDVNTCVGTEAFSWSDPAGVLACGPSAKEETP
jgi:hypothetical protein